jgi:hypothetical protein
MGGICIRCGALKGEAAEGEGPEEEAGVALSYIHRGLVVSKHEAERVRQVGWWRGQLEGARHAPDCPLATCCVRLPSVSSCLCRSRQQQAERLLRTHATVCRAPPTACWRIASCC